MRPHFRENDIDDTVLPSLTAEDLKELGRLTPNFTAEIVSLMPAGTSGRKRKTKSDQKIPPES